MIQSNTKKHFLLLIIILLFIVIDQSSKHYVELLYIEPIPVFDWLSILLVYNKGISFGFFSESTVALRWILISFTSIIALVVCIYAFREQNFIMRFAFGLISGGAIGNIIDRLSSRKAVVDFIDFHIGDWHWPTFNIADSFIAVGAFLLFLEIFKATPSKVKK